MAMREELVELKTRALTELDNVNTMSELENIRLKYLGKKGELTSVLRGMGALAPEERPLVGQLANEIRAAVEEKLEKTKNIILEKERARKLAEETIDITMPGRRRRMGHKHPITLAIDDIKEVFLGMGYEIADGPEVEYDHYNFELMNIPKNHPARDTQDTFYINENILLRTQTSSVQGRVMLTRKPPIKIICPGRVYRSDAIDASHSAIFHQVEGLVVDKGVTMGDLIGTLQVFAKHLFGEETKIRLRPHHFNFTEPSAEVDVSCWNCGGKGCRVCKGEGWVEVLGAGMVHPRVLEMCGIDPEIYSGFAFGIGVERTTMGKYNIDDMRVLYENDIRFLKQF